MTTFVGSHRILRAARPSDTAAVIFLLTLAAMFAGRHLFEGVPYQVSYSAMIGDTAGFIYVVLRAQEILKRSDDVYIPTILQRSDIHVAILAVSIVLGIIASIASLPIRHGQIMDVYHDVFIAPIFLYLAITLVPVMLYNGSRREMFEAGFYASLWLGLAAMDWATGMIAQRVWLAEHFYIVWPMLPTTIVWPN